MPMQLPSAVPGSAAMLSKWAAEAREVGEGFIVRARAADDEAAALEQQVREEAAARREARADRQAARVWLGAKVKEIDEA